MAAPLFYVDIDEKVYKNQQVNNIKIFTHKNYQVVSFMQSYYLDHPGSLKNKKT